MKKAILMVAVLWACGCDPGVKVEIRTPPPPVALATQQTPELEKSKVSTLRAEAHQRGLKWKVFCTEREDENAPDSFLAVAWPKGTESPIASIEDGGRDWWAEYGQTQVDAANSLYKSIQGPPNMKASHRYEASERERKHRACPPELKGE